MIQIHSHTHTHTSTDTPSLSLYLYLLDVCVMKAQMIRFCDSGWIIDTYHAWYS